MLNLRVNLVEMISLLQNAAILKRNLLSPEANFAVFAGPFEEMQQLRFSSSLTIDFEAAITGDQYPVEWLRWIGGKSIARCINQVEPSSGRGIQISLEMQIPKRQFIPRLFSLTGILLIQKLAFLDPAPRRWTFFIFALVLIVATILTMLSFKRQGPKDPNRLKSIQQIHETDV